jgi:predicted short-subunit dehydrogenase-like oxidoreductase (DUF2520 family)
VTTKALKVAIVGQGKVGRGLSAALTTARATVSIVSAKALVSGQVARPLRADIVVIAARDSAIPEVARVLAERGLVSHEAVVVHCAGALDHSVLASVRVVCKGVAQMHPMISFADPKKPPTLDGGHAHVSGDPEAVRRAKKLCLAIGLVPRTFPELDRIAYHAAAGLVANGAAALAAAGADLLQKAGARPKDIPAMLGPLLRSVAENVAVLGLPAALTGPVRRGDATGVGKHLDTLMKRAPELVPLYVACAMAQLPMARALGDARPLAFDEVEHVLVEASSKLSR